MRAEAADAHRRDRRLGAAGDHHVGVAARMISNESPIACADAEQAVHVAEVRPLGAEADRDLAGARLMIADGMKNGEILRGPPLEQRLVLALDGA